MIRMAGFSRFATTPMPAIRFPPPTSHRLGYGRGDESPWRRHVAHGQALRRLYRNGALIVQDLTDARLVFGRELALIG